jgi:hypothetical protein
VYNGRVFKFRCCNLENFELILLLEIIVIEMLVMYNMMAIVSLDSPLCEVPCLILHSVVYQDVTRQAKGLHHLKYVGALESGLAYLSRCNSGWFRHINH